MKSQNPTPIENCVQATNINNDASISSTPPPAPERIGAIEPRRVLSHKSHIQSRCDRILQQNRKIYARIKVATEISSTSSSTVASNVSRTEVPVVEGNKTRQVPSIPRESDQQVEPLHPLQYHMSPSQENEIKAKQSPNPSVARPTIGRLPNTNTYPQSPVRKLSDEAVTSAKKYESRKTGVLAWNHLPLDQDICSTYVVQTNMHAESQNEPSPLLSKAQDTLFNFYTTMKKWKIERTIEEDRSLLIPKSRRTETDDVCKYGAIDANYDPDSSNVNAVHDQSSISERNAGKITTASNIKDMVVHNKNNIQNDNLATSDNQRDSNFSECKTDYRKAEDCRSSINDNNTINSQSSPKGYTYSRSIIPSNNNTSSHCANDDYQNYLNTNNRYNWGSNKNYNLYNSDSNHNDNNNIIYNSSTKKYNNSNKTFNSNQSYYSNSNSKNISSKINSIIYSNNNRVNHTNNSKNNNNVNNNSSDSDNKRISNNSSKNNYNSNNNIININNATKRYEPQNDDNRPPIIFTTSPVSNTITNTKYTSNSITSDDTTRKGNNKNVGLRQKTPSTSSLHSLPPGNLPAGMIIFMISNTALGAGLFNFPQAFRKVGGIGTALSTQLSLLIFVLGACYVMALSSHQSQANSYHGMIRFMLGNRLKWLAQVLQVVYFLIGSVVYVILIGKQLTDITDIFTGSREVWYTKRTFLFVVFTIFFLFPLCVPGRLKVLSYINIVGYGGALAACSMAIYQSKSLHSQNSAATGHPTEQSIASPTPTDWTSILAGIAVMCFGYQSHISSPAVYSELRSRSPVKYVACACFSMCLCTLVYSITGVYGFKTFGDKTIPDILQNNSNESILITVARLAILCVLSSSFAAMTFSARSAIEGFRPLFRCVPAQQLMDMSGRTERIRRFGTLICWFVVTLLLSMVIENIQVLVYLTGGIAALFIFMFPGLCLTKFIGLRRGNLTIQKILLTIIALIYLLIGVAVFSLVTSWMIYEQITVKFSG